MPYDSIYQATKSSIEQGIYDLQQRLRIKNQLDLQRELTENILHEQKMYRQQKQLLDLQRIYYDNTKYNNALLQRTACDPYVNSVLYESSLNDIGAIGYQQLKETIRKQADHLEYLKRLQRLKEQSLFLDNPSMKNYELPAYGKQFPMKHQSPIQQFSSNRASPSQVKNNDSRKSPYKPSYNNTNVQYDQPLQQDSSALLQKYSKGIRAQQYNNDMQRLIDIEKRLRNIQQKSETKPYYPQGNESVVTRYQPKYDLNRQFERTKQKQKFSSIKKDQIIRNKIKQNPQYNKLHAQNIQNQNNVQSNEQNYQVNKKNIFNNQRVGEVINKQKHQQYKFEQKPKTNDLNDRGLYNIDNVVKIIKNKKPVKKEVQSKSPLKSDRTFDIQQVYRPSTNQSVKQKRLKSKGVNQNSSRTHSDIPIRKPNSRILPLDPFINNVLLTHLTAQQKIQQRFSFLPQVFKDIKMIKQKDNFQDLVNRFELESKGRKQIKNMINNDPRILRKHKKVVQ